MIFLILLCFAILSIANTIPSVALRRQLPLLSGAFYFELDSRFLDPSAALRITYNLLQFDSLNNAYLHYALRITNYALSCAPSTFVTKSFTIWQ